MLYRKKPVVIEALEWDGNNVNEIETFMGEHKDVDGNSFIMGENVLVSTPEGMMAADIGDYIIKGVKGEFYPCKPDIFKQTYEKVAL